MLADARWAEGTVIALRDVWHGQVWRAVPGVVARDDERETVAWVPSGSESVYPVDDDGREVRLFREGVRLTRRRVKADVVVTMRPGEPWSIWHFFHDGRLDQWYVNLEAFLGRRGQNYDSRDHKLDVIARPDGTTRLKDEDELEAAAALGHLDAAAVRRDAERVLASPPWPTGWEAFEPDPSWGIPALPPGWDAAP